MEFRGRFRPQAPGCSFDAQQASHKLRRPSAAQLQAAAAMLQLPQLGELAVRPDVCPVSRGRSHAAVYEYTVTVVSQLTQ